MISPYQLERRVSVGLGHRIHGDVKINYAAKDGRGRPCVNLEVYVSTHSTISVIAEPESIG